MIEMWFKSTKEGREAEPKRRPLEDQETVDKWNDLKQTVKEEAKATRAKMHKLWDKPRLEAPFKTPIELITYIIHVDGGKRVDIEERMIMECKNYPRDKDISLRELENYNFVQDVITDFKEVNGVWVRKREPTSPRRYLPFAIAFGIPITEKVYIDISGDQREVLYLHNESWGPLSRWSCNSKNACIFSDDDLLEIRCHSKPILYVLSMTPLLSTLNGIKEVAELLTTKKGTSIGVT